MTHVMPTEDEALHERSTDCPCEPEIDTNSNLGDIHIIHNAFDQRHLVIQAEAIKQTQSLRLVVEQGWTDSGLHDIEGNELWHNKAGDVVPFAPPFARWVRQDSIGLADRIDPPNSPRFVTDV